MATKATTHPSTLGDLKEAGYQTRSVKEELRSNLIEKLRNGENVFSHILGYEDSVIPDVQRAILARHSINLLGLRGQAKTTIARAMTALFDEYIPVVEGSEINDDPFAPISKHARELIEEKGDDTPIEWLHRSERYTEKLATPDVSVADLIGDVDPIKAANLKLKYSDERVIHFGLVPNANRGLFVINELPDLQPRIQVALFNILQEGDIQIRGFKFRLPLDIQFVFTANPEDYTNRGTIVTPLKDRIQSQVMTHYPESIETSKQITKQEADIDQERAEKVKVHELMEDLIENLAFEARDSEFIDQKSGVSARLPIAAYELLYSAVERRAVVNGEKTANARIGDLIGVIPAITGKVELVYEGEQEGPYNVAQRLIGQSIRSLFPVYFPTPGSMKRKEEKNPYEGIVNWFNGNELELSDNLPTGEWEKKLKSVDGLEELVDTYQPRLSRGDKSFMMEFVLHGLAEYSLLTKDRLASGMTFKDILSSVFSDDDDEDELA